MLITLVGKSGADYFVTVERVSDGYYRNNSSNVFSNGLSFNNKKIEIVEGSNENLASFSVDVNSDGWQDGLYFVRVHDESNQVISGTLCAVKGGVEVSPGEQTTVYDIYHADIDYIKNNNLNTDEYTVTWFKDAGLITSGITSVNIRVIKRLDGTDLVTNRAMTSISNTGIFKLDTLTTERQSAGDSYLAISTMVKDGKTYTFSKIVGRDAIQ